MNLLYFWVSIASAVGLWALWTFGFRPMFLDMFCFEISLLRADLDDLAESGSLPESSIQYEKSRRLLDGLLKIAPSFGVLQFILSLKHIEQCRRDGIDKSVEYQSTHIEVSEATERRLNFIASRTSLLIVRFLLLRAPLFGIFMYAVAFILYFFDVHSPLITPSQAMRKEAIAQEQSGRVSDMLAYAHQ